MKRIIAGLLSICLVVGLFAGVRAFAGNTDNGDMILMPGAVPVLGSNYKTDWKDDDWGGDPASDIARFTQTAEFAGIGFRGGVVMDSEEPIGNQVLVNDKGFGRYEMTMAPNTTVKADNNMFMMYVQLPVSVASIYRWDELMRFTGITVEQNGMSYSSNQTDFTNVKVRYLAEDAATWKEITITGGTIPRSLSGFCGYMMLDLSTAAKYQTWIENGFDTAVDYTVTQIKVQNGAVGGACGPFKIGGFYGIDTYKEEAITAQIKNVPVTKALSEYDPNPMKVTSTNMPGAFSGGGMGSTDTYGRPYGWGTGYGGWRPGSDEGANKTAPMKLESGGAGNYSHHIAYTADTPHGYLSDGASYEYWVDVKVNAEAAGAMLYVELPKTGLGYSSMKGTYADTGWYSAQTRKISNYAYLEKNGSNWVTGVAVDGELKLPDGFKGYIKINPDFDGAKKEIGWMKFSWGLFGGSYGDVILGGTWSIVDDQDSCYVQFDDSDAVRVADGTTPQPIRGTMKDPAYNGEWVNIGETANRVTADKEGVTCTFSENSEPFGTHMMRKMSSENIVKDVTISYVGWVPIDPAVNTAMIWMELPRSTSNTPVTISVEYPNCNQNDKWCWANSKNLQYAYLASDSNQWVNGVVPGDGSGLLSLPEGFKGYIKFDLSTLDAYRNGWKNASGEDFDYSQEYRLDQIGFKVSALGGEYGDFVLGTFMTLTYDSNSTYAVISNSDTAENGAPERLTNYKEDDLAGLLEELRGILIEIGEVDITDYALIERAIEIYEGLSQEYREQLTAEERADYEAKVTTYSQNYRPTFRGAAAYVPNGTNMAGFRLGSTIDAAKAVSEGYSVTSYGTVMMPKAAYNARNPKFDNKSTGAVLRTYENTTAQTKLQWNVDYTSRNWKEYADDFYFRSYVVYSDGTNNITVWNGSVMNRASRSAGEYEASAEEMTELGSGFVKQVEFEAPYYVTSITQVANLFGISVLSGHEYGNLNGDYDTKGNTGIIDEADVGLMRDYLVGKDAPRVRYMSDLNDDGAITVEDLVRFKRYLNNPDSVSLGERKNPELLDYNEPKDVYGEKSVSIIGDSISQGLNAGNLYDDSWASIFKTSFNQHFGSYNMGFVSFNDGYADKAGETDAATYKEIHKITMGADDQWTISKFWTGTPGLYLYTANNLTADSVLEIKLNRKEGGIDRHINGFYIYHTEGPGYGNFHVLVNDTNVAAVNCAADTKNSCARSDYIEIPESVGDEITIKIVKPSDVTGTVQIAGISYREDTTSPVVNNYSLSGCRLVDFSDDMLSQIATANVVILTLGTNDLGTGCDIEVFKEKLNIVVETCKKNGSKLVVGDVIWNLDRKLQGTAFKLALKDAALAMGDDGYYIDFNEIPVNKLLNVNTDSYHPTKQGHKLMAVKLNNFFGLN